MYICITDFLFNYFETNAYLILNFITLAVCLKYVNPHTSGND